MERDPPGRGSGVEGTLGSRLGPEPMVTDPDPLSERRPSGEVGESYRSDRSTLRKNARTAYPYMAAAERGVTPTASNLWWFNCPVALDRSPNGSPTVKPGQGFVWCQVGFDVIPALAFLPFDEGQTRFIGSDATREGADLQNLPVR